MNVHSHRGAPEDSGERTLSCGGAIVTLLLGNEPAGPKAPRRDKDVISGRVKVRGHHHLDGLSKRAAAVELAFVQDHDCGPRTGAKNPMVRLETMPF